MAVKNNQRHKAILALIGVSWMHNHLIAEESSTATHWIDTDSSDVVVKISRFSLPEIREHVEGIDNYASTNIVLDAIDEKFTDWERNNLGINTVQYTYNPKTFETDCSLYGVTDSDSGSRTNESSQRLRMDDCPRNASALYSLITRARTHQVARTNDQPPDVLEDLVTFAFSSNYGSYEWVIEGYVVERGDTLWEIAFRTTGMPEQWNELVLTHTHTEHVATPSTIHPGDRVMPSVRLASAYLARAYPSLPYRPAGSSSIRDMAMTSMVDSDAMWGLRLLNQMADDFDQPIDHDTDILLPAAIVGREMIDAGGRTPQEVSQDLYDKGDYGAFISAICPRDFANGEGSCVLPRLEVQSSPWLNQAGEILVGETADDSNQ